MTQRTAIQGGSLGGAVVHMIFVLVEGFESIESAERYVRLLVGCYRFKRFTDSCRRVDNGKAPLELAGVDLCGRDWLSYLLDN